MIAHASKLVGFSLVDADVHGRGDGLNEIVHARLDRARATSPVLYHPLDGAPHGFWAILGYREALRVLRDAQCFSSQAGTGIVPAALPFRAIHFSDPPDHTSLRRALAELFCPHAIEARTARVAALVHARLDALLARADLARRSGVEVVDGLAAPLVSEAVCEVVGLEEPEAVRQHLLAIARAEDDGADLALASERAAAHGDEIDRLVAAQLARPVPGTLIAALNESREALTLAERRFHARLCLEAGFDTTTHVLSELLFRLAHEPALFATLVADTQAIEPAIEECVRLASPILYFARVATRDTVLSGTQIARGERCVVFLSAANRDPEAFASPHRFLLRQKNPHLSFGAGAHFCLGSHLARLILRTVLRALVQRGIALSLVGSVERLRSSSTLGYRRLILDVTNAQLSDSLLNHP